MSIALATSVIAASLAVVIVASLRFSRWVIEHQRGGSTPEGRRLREMALEIEQKGAAMVVSRRVSPSDVTGYKNATIVAADLRMRAEQCDARAKERA